jgi:selenide,water dikinase
VYKWDDKSALVQTVDFFTPIVDDPFTYGQIAAANSLSDIYAMGGEPRTALAIAGFPSDGLEADVIREIFLGGFEKLREAGVALLGGHTVRDPEIKFGYAVTGSIDPSRMFTNAGARVGDLLLLTKPIGTGVIGTAIKFGRAPEPLVRDAVASMITLNRAAADVLRRAGPDVVHACTDITGFGLIGHASNIAAASRVTMMFTGERIPVFAGVREIVAANRAGGMKTNAAHYGQFTRVRAGVDPAIVDLCYDPQTSGGLLVAVAPGGEADLVRTLAKSGVNAARIGLVEGQSASRVVIQ